MLTPVIKGSSAKGSARSTVISASTTAGRPTRS